MASSLTDSNVHPHDRFFFADGNLYLIVEDTLYCVHKFLFEIHATMFPNPDRQTSLTNPYVLEDVKKPDFDRLLAHLYPRALGVEETRTSQDWVSVLGLAFRWGFDSLRSRAISKIEQILDSPIDMVTIGRQYGIPNILLPGYAVLCQSTAPLTHEDGLRLGMEDVVNIYRIRHELYGSCITPVPLEAAFAKVKEAGLGAEHLSPELDGEQDTTWTDVVSVTASQISATENEERVSIILTPNVDSLPLVSDTTTLVSEKTEQPHIDAHFPNNELNDSNPNSGSLKPLEDFELLEELAMSDFNIVSSDLIQWANTKDIQTLDQIVFLIVEKAIENLGNSQNPCLHLCKAMVKYTRMLHQMIRLVIEKTMKEPHQFQSCARLCRILMIQDSNGRLTTEGSLFSERLVETYQESLKTIAASIGAAGELTARVRRRRLVEFIGTLMNYYITDWKAMQTWAPNIVNNWITALLDANNEEKVITLCMVMMCARGLCTSQNSSGWLTRVRNVARETSNPRVRKLLQGVSVTERGWAVKQLDKDCTVQ